VAWPRSARLASPGRKGRGRPGVAQRCSLAAGDGDGLSAGKKEGEWLGGGEKLFDATRGYYITGSGTARHGFDVSRPIKILDQKSRVTRRKMIKFYKIQWINHTEEEATWENEDFLRSQHLDFELS
jgi:hypothetical protein